VKLPYLCILLVGKSGYSPLNDETPCSFWIHETISNIASGTGFLKKVISVEIFADGYVSNCPNENETYFELSGELCKE